MSWYSYEDSDSKADANRAVQRELEKRRKRGEKLDPVLPAAGKQLSTTFWGQAWNKNLMAYSDYESRMPRGRSYFRSGKVLGLTIAPGQVTSIVAGSRVYEVEILIQSLAAAAWKVLQLRCQGKIGDLMDLLSGDLSSEVMREVTDLNSGLFPSNQQIQLSCTCPDWADMCKHCAATLYAIGSLLDDNPRHLFTLRQVDPQALIGTVEQAISSLTAPTTQATDRTAALDGMDLSEIFGIGLTLESNASTSPAESAPKAKQKVAKIAPLPKPRQA